MFVCHFFHPHHGLTCPLKNSGWKTILSLFNDPFDGDMLVFGGVGTDSNVYKSDISKENAFGPYAKIMLFFGMANVPVYTLLNKTNCHGNELKTDTFFSHTGLQVLNFCLNFIWFFDCFVYGQTL